MEKAILALATASATEGAHWAPASKTAWARALVRTVHMNLMSSSQQMFAH